MFRNFFSLLAFFVSLFFFFFLNIFHLLCYIVAAAAAAVAVAVAVAVASVLYNGCWCYILKGVFLL